MTVCLFYSMCNSVSLYVSNCFALSWPGRNCKWELFLNLPTWLNKGEINQIKYKKYTEQSKTHNSNMMSSNGFYICSLLHLPPISKMINNQQSAWKTAAWVYFRTCVHTVFQMISQTTRRSLSSLQRAEEGQQGCVRGWLDQQLLDLWKETPSHEHSRFIHCWTLFTIHRLIQE